MDISDYNDSDQKDQIYKNNEERVTNDIEVLKLGRLGSQINIDDTEK